jgi:hypothetical protein
MRHLSKKKWLFVLVGFITASPVSAFENLSRSLSSEQQACFSKAMVGMDSVINARLGVPPEHALALSSNPRSVAVAGEPYDINMLRIILDAYLWKDTPHSYAINVFYGCAQQTSHRKQAKLD